MVDRAFIDGAYWDEEKYFDNFKHDLANAKAWGKKPVAIEQQALMGMMTYILTQLFLHRRYQELDLPEGDKTQFRKQQRKVECYLEQQEAEEAKSTSANSATEEEKKKGDDEQAVTLQYDAYRAFYTGLSRITRQVWRFLKNSFSRKSSLALYERQLRPLLLRYL